MLILSAYNKNMKILLKENYKFFIGVLIFIGYYFSPFSIFFWNPALMFLIHFFLFPFFLFPEDFFIASGGIVAVPNPITVGIALIVIVVWIFGFSFCVKWLAKKLSISFMIITVLILGILLVIGGVTEQRVCINKFEAFESKYHGKYLEDLGFMQFALYTPFEKIGPSIFYLVNGLDVVEDNKVEGSSVGRHVLAKIKKGDEFEKVCWIKSYKQVYDGLNPMTEQGLFRDGGKWEYIDSDFCDSGQLNKYTKDECYKKFRDMKSIFSGKYIDDSGKYIDEYISFIIDDEKFNFHGGPSKSGINFEEIESDMYANQYDISKSSGYDKISDISFPEPLMVIYIPSSPDYYHNPHSSLIQIVDESNLKLGNHEYVRKIFTGGYGFEYASYDTQIKGRRIVIDLISRQYFERYPELREEFEKIISSIEYKF